MAEVKALHNSMTIELYTELLNKTLQRWRRAQPEFYSYFYSQWVNRSFNTWQIFTTPPGFHRQMVQSNRITVRSNTNLQTELCFT